MPDPSNETWVQVGKVGKTFGLKGEVVIHYFADTPERFAPDYRVFIVTSNGRVAARVASSRQLSKKFVASFRGRSRIEDVEEWVGCPVEVPTRDLPRLEEGRYYHYQLIGLRVYTDGGRFVGVLEEILDTPGNDVYCVRHEDREILVPAIDDAIAQVDLAAGTMTLKDLEGMIEP